MVRVYGTITDSQTQKPLAGVDVVVNTLTNGHWGGGLHTKTDIRGYYEFYRNPGTHQILTKYYGEEITLGNEKEVLHNILVSP